jgi:putative addiction module CopG family antidote
MSLRLRYYSPMTIDFPLPPHLQQFVNEQLATGHFRSESEIIHTALHLLEERYHSREEMTSWLKQEIARGMSSRPSAPVTKQFWQQIRDRLATGHSPANEA